MGTLLFSKGVVPGTCLEKLNLTHPRLIEKIHKEYIQAGSTVLVANTFGANRSRLSEKGDLKQLHKINRAGVTLAKRVARYRLVFASVGPLGVKAKNWNQKKKIFCFKEQAQALESAKPDGYLVETMTSLSEAKLAAEAIRSVSKKPLIVSMVPFPKKNQKHYRKISKILRHAGVTCIGFNCGQSPQEAYQALKKLKKCDAGPFCIRSTAGLPSQICSPKLWARWMVKIKKLGVTWMGGCCGTTPGHIKLLLSLS